MASVRAQEAWTRLVYPDEAVVIGRPLFVPYATPGLALGRIYALALREYVDAHGALPQLVLLANHGIVAIALTAAGVEAVSTMAVKGARVRATAYTVGGLAPLSDADVEKFFARDDIAERRANLARAGDRGPPRPDRGRLLRRRRADLPDDNFADAVRRGLDEIRTEQGRPRVDRADFDRIYNRGRAAQSGSLRRALATELLGDESYRDELHRRLAPYWTHPEGTVYPDASRCSGGCTARPARDRRQPGGRDGRRPDP